MGATLSTAKSTNNVDNIVNIITNVVVSNANNCSAGNNLSQFVNLGNVSGSTIGNISLSASAFVSLDCLQSSTSDSQLQSQITNQLSQYAQSQAQSSLSLSLLSASSSVSENTTNLINNVSSNFKIDNVKSCITSNNLQQQLNITSIQSSNIGSISLVVNASTVSKCIQKDTNLMSSITNLSNSISQSSKSSALAGLDTAQIVAIAAIVVIFSSSSSISAFYASQ